MLHHHMAMSRIPRWPCQSPDFLNRLGLMEAWETKLSMLQLRPLIPSRLRLLSSAYHDVRRKTKVHCFPYQPRPRLWLRLQMLISPLELLQAGVHPIRLDISHPIAPLLPQPYAVRCLGALARAEPPQPFLLPLALLTPQEETQLYPPQPAESRQRTQCPSIDEAGRQQRTR